MGWQQCNIGKKPYLTTYQGGGPPPNNEKMQNTVVQHPEILKFCGCNGFFWMLVCIFVQLPEISIFVVVTAFFGNIGTKPYLTTYQGGAPPQHGKIQNNDGQQCNIV